MCVSPYFCLEDDEFEVTAEMLIHEDVDDELTLAEAEAEQSAGEVEEEVEDLQQVCMHVCVCVCGICIMYVCIHIIDVRILCCIIDLSSCISGIAHVM